MLIVLDTTVIVNDPMCAGIAWRVLANAPSAWDIEVYVPEVVVVEAIAGYRRRLSDAASRFAGWVDKYANVLGLAKVTRTVDAALKEAASSYPAQLRGSLNDLHATVLRPPEVDHMIMVERAVSRRRPCDDKGDGYRDTLNWLTILALASQYPNAPIIWASDNSRDFGRDDSDELHEDLIGDLSDIGAEKRVRWMRTLGDLVLALAAEHASEASTNVREVQARLREEALNAFIRTDVLARVVDFPLNPRRCGLPINTVSAKVAAVGDPEELVLTVRGATADDQTAVEFDLEATTTILLETLPGATFEVADPASSFDLTGSAIPTAKKLKFRGLITLDRFDRPVGSELISVSARDDDPGLRQWAMIDMIRTYPKQGFQTTVAPELLETIRAAAIPPELLETIRAVAIRPELLQAMRAAAIPPELLQAMRAVAIRPELLQAMRAAAIPPELLETIRAAAIPPELLETIRAAATWPKSAPQGQADAETSENEGAMPESADDDQRAEGNTGETNNGEPDGSDR